MLSMLAERKVVYQCLRWHLLSRQSECYV